MKKFSDSHLTLKFLRECFDVDVENGNLIWKVRPDHHVLSGKMRARYDALAGSVVGWVDNLGYRTARLDREAIKIHRLIFAMVNDIEPSEMTFLVDHIDGDRANNAPENLRKASFRDNAYNSPFLASRNNTSGYRGVHEGKCGKWVARIKAHNKNVNLGSFKTKEEAYAAYLGAAKLLHGDFFRHPEVDTKAAA